MNANKPITKWLGGTRWLQSHSRRFDIAIPSGFEAFDANRGEFGKECGIGVQSSNGGSPDAINAQVKVPAACGNIRSAAATAFREKDASWPF